MGEAHARPTARARGISRRDSLRSRRRLRCYILGNSQSVPLASQHRTNGIQMMPFDTAKSRYQKECLYSATRPKFPEYSWIRNLRSNYPGFTISIARSGLTHGIFFFTYETIKRHIEIDYLDRKPL